MNKDKRNKEASDDDLQPELHAGDAAKGITRGDRRQLNAAAAEGPLSHVPPPTTGTKKK